MKLFQLLTALDPSLQPRDCKIHLAVWNGIEDPLHVYFEGRFDEWQSWQTKKNFQRPRVVSLIALRGTHRWLFAGTHDSTGCEWVAREELFQYRLTRRQQTDELDGRLLVDFTRTGRQSYLRAENWVDVMQVAEIRAERLAIGEFPGYSKIVLSKPDLDLIVGQGVDSWRSALGSVSGIYVIADTESGRLYVGSAYGEGGIWSRWCAYSQTGHGGNAELKALLREHGPEYAGHLQFGVLEIADTHASREDVLERESHWKSVLLTREHGLNDN